MILADPFVCIGSFGKKITGQGRVLVSLKSSPSVEIVLPGSPSVGDFFNTRLSHVLTFKYIEIFKSF